MAVKEDLSFGFNTKFFESGINRINKQFSTMKTTAAGVAKGVTKGIGQMTSRFLILAGGIKGVTKLFDQIPEIGKAFSIAKEIVFKNFLFPLRKAIFPLLQRLLDFIRDNRKTFVIWGQSLANIFDSMVGGLKSIFDIGKQLGDLFINFVNRTFGLQLKSFQDLINLTTFKIAVAIEFLKNAFPAIIQSAQPFIDLIAIGLNSAITGAISLVSGFLKGISGIEKPLKSILETVFSIVDAFTTIDESGNKTNRILNTIGETIGIIATFVANVTDAFLIGLKPAIIALEEPFNRIAGAFKRLFGDTAVVEKWKTLFQFIGEVVGTALVGAFNTIATVIELVTFGIEKLLDIFSSGPFQKFLDFAGDIAAKVGGFFSGALQGVTEFITGKKVDDAIITKKGEVIQTSPEDNILAFKKFPVMESPGGGGVTIGELRLDFTGMNINVLGEDQEAGKKVGIDIVDIIRQRLNTELVRMGA